MYIGMDCSIKDVALVSEYGHVLVSTHTSLTLNSSLQEVVNTGREIANATRSHLLSDYDCLVIDYSFLPMKARRRQTALNTMLITAIVTHLNHPAFAIEPSTIRKWCGLKSRASKLDVWQAFGDAMLDGFRTEHEKDAYILAQYGKDVGLIDGYSKLP